ncbi:MAG: cytochrome c oxidase accessory protein CcoG [Acidihalobacter sp.]|uniref:cytochrome c oxidase accessory protein CcoG n=1 Tax=Acidihalobacter sp. TaxID=1872108 RepID=UPI00307D3A1B
MTESPVQLYRARTAIHPRSVSGRFRNAKYAVLALAYGVFFLLPWLRWSRDVGPQQALLFDLPARRFYVFDLVVHPQEIFWLAGLLVIAALLLFFVTGVAGRVWCGYFCFQTLWTDVYMLIERLVQGEQPARIRLAKAPWGMAKLFKLALTHVLWLAVAFATGLTFTLYWADAPALVGHFFTGQAPFPAYATTLLLTVTTYVFAGLAREQVCTYMCPYARFQSVMFDRDTLIVSYDRARGEGANGRYKPDRELKERETRQAAGHGDCIDCGYCVQVCPTGVDIREGLQVECIHCALCVDACDGIMDTLGWPRGLVRYTSQNALEGRRTRLLKPKTLGYGVVLLIATALLIGSVAGHPDIDVSVRQTRNPLSVTLSSGEVQNRYTIKVDNTSGRPLRLRLVLDGLPGAHMTVLPSPELHLRPEARRALYVKVRLAPEPGQARRLKFRFRLQPQGRTSEPEPVSVPSQFYTR